ncbi:MAG: hypothetical protein M1821_006570 [Bathelium mastoideum]|nr:MAG: hypothetical protein M1821_006570 [Bathelium mastoideum]
MIPYTKQLRTLDPIYLDSTFPTKEQPSSILQQNSKAGGGFDRFMQYLGQICLGDTTAFLSELGQLVKVRNARIEINDAKIALANDAVDHMENREVFRSQMQMQFQAIQALDPAKGIDEVRAAADGALVNAATTSGGNVATASGKKPTTATQSEQKQRNKQTETPPAKKKKLSSTPVTLPWQNSGDGLIRDYQDSVDAASELRREFDKDLSNLLELRAKVALYEEKVQHSYDKSERADAKLAKVQKELLKASGVI